MEQSLPHTATTCTSTLGGPPRQANIVRRNRQQPVPLLCFVHVLQPAVSRVCILFSCSAPPLPIVVGSPSAALGPTWPQVVSLLSSLASRPYLFFSARTADTFAPSVTSVRPWCDYKRPKDDSDFVASPSRMRPFASSRRT